MEFYEKVQLRERNYDLTSSPSIPKVAKKTHDAVSLKWGKPVKGADKIIKYNVNVYVRRQRGQTKVSNQDTWSMEESLCHTFFIRTCVEKCETGEKCF